MSVFKIFPSKDATIYSDSPDLNTGIDEILELRSTTDSISRILLQFSSDDIANLTQLVTGSYDAYLKLSLANAENLYTEYTIEVKTLAQDWDMGTGRYSNSPITSNGVTWNSASISNQWTIPGGHYNNTSCSQSFEYNDDKDIEINITDIYGAWLIGSSNNGILLKLSDPIESGSLGIDLKYFSKDTHTIYPPYLEVRWDNSQYITGSLHQPTTSNIVVSLGNNKGQYEQDSIQRFRVNCRDKYPIRTFATSSAYLNNQILPPTSYWSLKDLDTEEIIIDYDQNYTKLSCDSQGNYFDIYMSGLEPERYYKILVKTIISGSTLIFDNLVEFKVL